MKPSGARPRRSGRCAPRKADGRCCYVRPYKTWDNRIEGAVISLQDVDALKRTLDQTREYADTIVESAREPIVVLNAKLQVTAANPAFYRAFDVSRDETERRLIYELGNGQWNIPKLRELLEEIVPQNSRVDDFQMSHDFPHLGAAEHATQRPPG